MLQAIAQGKSRIYRRYIGHKDNTDEKRVAAEDEITALILGPLKFLTPKERARLWHRLLNRFGAGDLPKGEPDDAVMKLWKKFKGLDRSVEPDLMVYLIYPDNQKIAVIVELKWRSPLSGANQLHVQWEQCLDSQSKETGFHLFIGPDTSAASSARTSEEHGNPWQGRLLAADWASIKEMLLNTKIFNTTEGKDWAKNVCVTLEKLGIRPFRGFGDLPATSIVSPPDNMVFWEEFSGFRNLQYSQIPPWHSDAFFSSR